MGSCSVEDFTLAKSMRLLIKWIRPSNNEVPYSEFSIDWTSNRRHLSSSLCNLACASVMFFLNICSSGSALVPTITCLPSR